MTHHRDFYFAKGSYSGTFTPDPDEKGVLVGEGGKMLGRKVYRHRGAKVDLIPARLQDAIIWEATGTEAFSFRVHFENLSCEELGLVAFALDLWHPDEPNTVLRQHYGYGKPAGFGAVRIEIAGELHPANRYVPDYRARELDPRLLGASKARFFQTVAAETEVWEAFKKWFAWPRRPVADIKVRAISRKEVRRGDAGVDDRRDNRADERVRG